MALRRVFFIKSNGFVSVYFASSFVSFVIHVEDDKTAVCIYIPATRHIRHNSSEKLSLRVCTSSYARWSLVWRGYDDGAVMFFYLFESAQIRLPFFRSNDTIYLNTSQPRRRWLAACSLCDGRSIVYFVFNLPGHEHKTQYIYGDAYNLAVFALDFFFVCFSGRHFIYSYSEH